MGLKCGPGSATDLVQWQKRNVFQLLLAPPRCVLEHGEAVYPVAVTSHTHTSVLLEYLPESAQPVRFSSFHLLAALFLTYADTRTFETYLYLCYFVTPTYLGLFFGGTCDPCICASDPFSHLL